MLRRFLRQRLAAQCVVLGAVLLSFVILTIVALFNSVAEARALEHARVTASLVASINDWASQFHGVWVLSDPADPTLQVGDYIDSKQARMGGSSEGEKGAEKPLQPAAQLSPVDIARLGGLFNRKAPTAVTREVSDALKRQVGEGVQFRLVNDRFFDARNAPNRFENVALERLRAADGSDSEYREIVGGRLNYARKVTVNQSCLRCHDSPERSPEAIRVKFSTGQGWGYKDGGFGGIVSVSVPVPYRDAGTILDGVSWLAWTALGACLVVVLMIVAWLVGLVRSTESITRYVQRVVNAKPGAHVGRFELDDDELSSDNELHHLSADVKALHRALQLAQADRVV